MSERISVYAGPPIEAALACLGDRYNANRSGRLNTICERYLVMVADELSRLELSRNQWCAVLDANNGVELFTGMTEINSTMLWANVHDAGPQLGQKWGIDHAALVAALQRLPKSTVVAILEVCDRFWSRAEVPTDEALRASGLHVATVPPTPRT